jgi:cellulose biosynthesis protein BcsQ
MTSIVFFNNKSGVGKTSLVYHLAWMYADLGVRVIAADLDPQADLTSMFLPEDRLQELWPDGDHPESILGVVAPVLRGQGEISDPHVETITGNLGLLPGDLGLSRVEARLSAAWPDCMDRDEAASRLVSTFRRLLARAAETREADLVLIDVGPNLGAINQSAILAANHVVVPLTSDLYSLQGLRSLGPTLRDWRTQWNERLTERPQDPSLRLPPAEMVPIGYILMQRAVRADRPRTAYERWAARIPAVYREEVLGEPDGAACRAQDDPSCLAMLRNYRSLMPMAQDALKPMFHLKPADGALGGHTYAVQDCYEDFSHLARRIAERCGLAGLLRSTAEVTSP